MDRLYISIRCSWCGSTEQVPETVANSTEGSFLCSSRCEEAEADQRERMALRADLDAEDEREAERDWETSAADRYDSEAGHLC